jgi:tRNA uridine 5-carboxymethylaminomethyl modification enzyme
VFHVKQSGYDVLVVGAGHAGVEAAHAAMRMGAKSALVTLSRSDLGALSCNPAIGGLGKGHLVREIDALDGLMGRLADAAGIQFRLLNRSKGPAVRGPRAQMDRSRYADSTKREFEGHNSPDLIFGEVVDIATGANGEVTGVILRDGSEVSAKAVILATGTFLGGRILLGAETWSAGRHGDSAAVDLAHRLRSHSLPIGRLKTGTPPRILSRSIDWSKVLPQPGDAQPVPFSFLNEGGVENAVNCGIVRTCAATHDIVRQNLDRSPMFSGMIEGVGPRYCPSLEDKVTRFADKDSHQVFLEPEGVASELVYPNGISTSLPAEVQDKFVRTIDGLERAEIARPGYAIEYDFIDPRVLTRSLALPTIPGLFLAGQINGTTGYEEAAAQGLVAGLNAARFAIGGEEIIFTRDQSYIGVMIDDLVTRGVTEPYRMFTSRAEFRLSLRADNADHRLTEWGRGLGCVSDRRAERAAFKADQVAEITTELSRLRSTKARLLGRDESGRETSRSLYSLMSDPDIDLAMVQQACSQFAEHSEEAWQQVAGNALYANYEARERKEAALLQKDEVLTIPRTLNFDDIGSLSTEQRHKLASARPETVAQAKRIEGMTPAGILALQLHLRKLARPVNA